MPNKGSYRERPEYQEAKALYFSTTLSVIDVAGKLRLPFPSVRYWSQQELWKPRRDAMLSEAEFNAQSNKRSSKGEPPAEPNATAIVAVCNQIAELRSMTKAQLAKILAEESVESGRRYLALTKTVDLLLERMALETTPTDAQRLSTAIATLLDKAQMLAGLPTSISERRKDGPQKPRRAPRADVAEAAEALGMGGAPGAEKGESDDEG